MKASGALPSPSVMNSRCLILPSVTHCDMSRIKIRVPALEVADDEAPEGQSLRQDIAQNYRSPLRRHRISAWYRVVVGNQATYRDTRKRIQLREHGVKYLAADILEINIDSLWTRLLELCRKIRTAMVKALLKAELPLNVVTLLLAAGYADRPGTLDPRNLPDRRSDRPGCCGDHDRLAGLWPSDFKQAGIGGHARHAEHTESRRDGSDAWVDLPQAVEGIALASLT
jgi:hypothetical protein